VIANIRRCRVVVTGSYHAAVFALSNGIPVVCVVGSHYYGTKFYGLVSQFGEAGKAGCRVVVPNAEDPEGSRAELIAAIREQWDRAEALAAPLRAAAAQQIAAHHGAYARLRHLHEALRRTM
jgi:colanic acid/amylovoran biosynthesis protein